MVARLGNVLLMFAMLASLGAHWGALQSVAWTTMFAGNLSSEPFAVALKNTFDGRHLCPLCKQIAAGKKSEKKTESVAPVQKFEFPPSPAQQAFFAPAEFEWQFTPDASYAFWFPSPPVPPPRAYSA